MLIINCINHHNIVHKCILVYQICILSYQLVIFAYDYHEKGPEVSSGPFS